MDDDAEFRASKRVAVKIKKGTRIDFQLTMPDNIKNDFSIDEERQMLIWDGDTNSIEFLVSVADTCSAANFFGRVHVYVNMEPQFDMVFKTKIVKREIAQAPAQRFDECADIDFFPFDKVRERNVANKMLTERLKGKIAELEKNLIDENDAQEYLSNELKMCRKCLEIIENKTKKAHRDVLKVFISSTSDMLDFRNILKERVLELGMFPDMYEMWGQGDDYPRDVCCEHVLDSDIFLCILGSKYGFVEPIWDKSMTEIEYRMATNADIPILIYIQKNYKELIDALSDEEKAKASRQLDFIRELSTKRTVCLFPNENSLALSANSELLTLKHNLQS